MMLFHYLAIIILVLGLSVICGGLAGIFSLPMYQKMLHPTCAKCHNLFNKHKACTLDMKRNHVHGRKDKWYIN